MVVFGMVTDFCQIFTIVHYIPIGLRCVRRYRHVSRPRPSRYFVDIWLKG